MKKVTKLERTLEHHQDILVALCESFSVAVPTSVAAARALRHPSPAASPLDSPVIALGNLSLGGESATSQKSRASSANSSVKSTNSGTLCSIVNAVQYTTNCAIQLSVHVRLGVAQRPLDREVHPDHVRLQRGRGKSKDTKYMFIHENGTYISQ
jgi:hypothetical protein